VSAPGADDLLELATSVAARAGAGEEVEAYVLRGRDTEVEVFDGDIESLSSATSAGIGIRVVRDSRQGFAYVGSLDDGVIAETLAEARDNAGFASPDDAVSLAAPDGVAPAGLDLWRDDLSAFATDDKIARATELEAAVRGADRRIRQVQSAGWGDSAVEVAVATSTGIAARSRRTTCYVSVYAAAGDGDDTQTGAGWSVGRSPADIDVAKAAADAVERATRLLGATKPRSRHLTVVLEPRVTASLLAILAGTLDGESVSKGRSLFAGRLGETVASSLLTLVDDPTDAEAFGATPFDAEGLATRRNVLVEAGTLRRYLYNTFAARRVGVTSTASAVRAGYQSAPGVGARALAAVPGDLPPERIWAEVGDGLLVQSVSNLHSGVNPVSGDFSVGAEGLLIRGGSLDEPVREINIASTLQRMLQGVVAVGSDLERLPGSAAGVSLAVADVAMGGF
jgi:PmbA protein